MSGGVIKELSPGVSLIAVPKVCDPRGNLSFLQNGPQLPFEMSAVEWFYNLPHGSSLPGRAYYTSRRCIICLSGSCEVEYVDSMSDDSSSSQRVALTSPAEALLVDAMVWHSLENFASNTVIAVLTSKMSADTDVIETFNLFKVISDETGV